MPRTEPTKTVTFLPTTPDLERKQRIMWAKIIKATEVKLASLPQEPVDDSPCDGPYQVEQLSRTHGRILKGGQAIRLSRAVATLENCRIAARELNRIYAKRNAAAPGNGSGVLEANTKSINRQTGE